MGKISVLMFGDAVGVVEELVREGYHVVTAALEEVNLAALKAIRQQAPELQAAVICNLSDEKKHLAHEVIRAHGRIPHTVVVLDPQSPGERVRAILEGIFRQGD